MRAQPRLVLLGNIVGLLDALSFRFDDDASKPSDRPMSVTPKLSSHTPRKTTLPTLGSKHELGKASNRTLPDINPLRGLSAVTILNYFNSIRLLFNTLMI